MEQAYKRPEKLVELPSGKKISIVEYFSNWEAEEIQKEISRGQKTKMGATAEEMKEQMSEVPTENVVESYRRARELAIKKLIDADGKEYAASPENLREFIASGEDSEKVDAVITEMMNKKKITENPSAPDDAVPGPRA